MKNLFKATLLATGIFAAAQVYAQEHHDSNVGHQIGKTAKNVGHKTSEVAAKGAHTGPGGQSIYINSHSQYYYVNKTGHRVYLKKSELKYKPSR
jgi:hypothetical protein